ncbi:MAG: ATP-binding cassette domain-containing protein [Candidatus Omnitrophica bacterium]|nr:ATP-binding cassette domain-containing protein [Candidatus Omnitrophota bacterium]
MILEVKNIHKDFVIERGILKREAGLVRALDGVSFRVEEFSSLGVAGESGSGKTTLAKIILKLMPPTSGEIIFDTAQVINFRKDVQIIFQNPYNSLSPKMRIFDMLTEPLIIHKIAPKNLLKDKAIDLLRLVGLDESVLDRLPIEFSGGQRQRICIARALASEPKLIVLDEPISSLDLTIQAQMLDLFLELKTKLKLTYIFISHNLAVVKHIADKVLIMQNGRIIEEGKAEDIFRAPQNPYTVALLNAAKS